MNDMIIPTLMQRWALDDPDATAFDLLWRWHRHLQDVDRAAEQLGGITVNRMTELCDLWTGEHLQKGSGWGRELTTVRRQVAVELLQTRLTAQRLADILRVTPEEFARSVTMPANVDQWLAYDAAICDGVDRRTAAANAGVRWDTARDWTGLRPWTAAAAELDDLRKRTPALDRWKPLFEQGMLPTEAYRHLASTEPGCSLSSAQNAFTVWQRGGGTADRTVVCARIGCGTRFERFNANARFCSDKCSWTVANLRRTKRRQASTMRTVTCGLCGTTFQTTRAARQWCSETCATAGRKRRSRERATAVTENPPAFPTSTHPEHTLASTHPGEDAP